jgi:alkaline phosphatase
MNRFFRATGASLSVLALCAPVLAQDALPQANDSYFVAAQAELATLIAAQPNTGKAKNIILFVGDGMSIPTITASRIYEGQNKGVDGESNVLAFEKLLPWTALSKTYTHDSQVADSAPTATAMVSGVKSLNGTIGVSQKVTLNDCSTQAGNEVTSIFEQAEDAGLATGVISTARITHATPAATYAHTAGRDWESDANLPEGAAGKCADIASQLVNWPHGDGFEVVLGGGRSNFLPNTVADAEYPEKMGARKDGKDLIAEWQAKHNDGEFVWNLEQFNAVKPETGHLFGLFEQSHMQYEADRSNDAGGEPSIAEMTVKAIDLLSRNDKGFVLMVESGRIDHAHHAGNAARALSDTVALSEAVQAAYDKVNPEETLIVLTADHSHVFGFAGYPGRNNPILGIAGTADDGKGYTTLGYLNGPGAVLYAGEEPTLPEGATEKTKLTVRPDPAHEDTTDIDYLQQALVPMSSESHAGDDVAIFAQGPWGHLFHGVVEQNVIYHVMAKAMGLDASAK